MLSAIPSTRPVLSGSDLLHMAPSRDAFHLWWHVHVSSQTSETSGVKLREWWQMCMRIREITSVYIWMTSSAFVLTKHRHLCPLTLNHPSIYWTSCSIFSSQCRSYFNPPARFTLTICLHTPARSLAFSYGWIHMFLSPALPPQVGLYINHHLILHRQPGCLPNGPEDGGAHRVGRRPGGSDGDWVRHHAWRIHDDLLSGQRLHASLHVMECLHSSITVTHGHSPKSL